jgi:hypothetical protein
MTVNIDQANALVKEYADLIRSLQAENLELKEKVIELEFELNAEHNKEYDC